MERTTRRALIGVAGGGAAAAAVAAIAGGSEEGRPTRVSRGATARTTDRFGLGDVGIANFLLLLQWVEQDVYALAGSRDPFRGFGEDEREHAERLRRTVHELGSHTIRRPLTRLRGAGRATLLQYALTVEDAVAGACLGQLGAIDTPELLRVVLTIHSVDARHAAVLGELSGLDPAPDGAVAQPLDAGTVLARLRPLLRRV